MNPVAIRSRWRVIRRPLMMTVVVVLSESCAEARGDDASSHSPSVRQLQETKWKTEWRVGDALVEHRSRMPLRAVLDDRRVYAVDPTHGSLLALDSRTGKVIWVARGGSDTATKLLAPHDVTVTRSGHVVVADMHRKALIVFDSTGTARRSIPFNPTVYSVCAIGDSVLMQTWSLKRPVWLLDLAGAGGVVAKFDLPWPELVNTTPDKSSGSFQGNDARDACVFTREVGDGYAIWRAGAFGLPRTFVDQSARIGSATPAAAGRPAMSSSFVGNDIYVTFGGADGDRRRAIDVYDGTSGEYKRTLQTPIPLMWLTHRRGQFVGIAPTKSGRELVEFRVGAP